MNRARLVLHATRVSAEDRARQAWADMARETKTDVRSMGVHGPLRRLDVATSGTRGKAVPKGMSALAREMRDHGVTQDEAAERLMGFAQTIAALVYGDVPKGAA